jgi:hypothetical protein
VSTATGLSASAPQLVFEGKYFADPRINVRERTYDVSPDGQRFLMIKDTERAEGAADGHVNDRRVELATTVDAARAHALT